MEYVGLLDCNNFFVSCERLFRPDLTNRPTIVLSSNDGCVVARSPEIKAMGIPMGIPYFQVKDELEAAGTAVFSSNFTLYRDISRRVMTILGELVADVDQYSVDEAFFRLTGTEAEIQNHIAAVKREVEAQVGVPVSIGAAKTKTIAKLASQMAKKGVGSVLLTGATWQEQQSRVLLAEVWGIGRQTSSKMRDHGLVTVADLVVTPRDRIGQLFGIEGVRKFDELQEIPVRRLHDRADTFQQSIMSSRSFAHNVRSLPILEDAISYHVAEAARELREIGGVAGAIDIHILPRRHGDWFLHNGRAGQTFSSPTADTSILLREALSLLSSVWQSGVPYRKAGVVLSMLSDAAWQPIDLFGVVEQSKKKDVTEVVDKLNTQFGHHTVTYGRLHSDHLWQANRLHASPRYTTNWSELAAVRA